MTETAVNRITAKMLGMLKDPVSTADNLRSEDLKETHLFVFPAVFVIVLLTFLCRSLLDGGIFKSGPVMFIAACIVLFIVNIICFLILVGVVHLFASLLGARRGAGRTYKAYAYALVPVVIFGWIPYLGIIAYIWSFILEIISMRELHNLETWKAALAVVMPVLIMIILTFAAYLMMPHSAAVQGV